MWNTVSSPPRRGLPNYLLKISKYLKLYNIAIHQHHKDLFCPTIGRNCISTWKRDKVKEELETSLNEKAENKKTTLQGNVKQAKKRKRLEFPENAVSLNKKQTNKFNAQIENCKEKISHSRAEMKRLRSSEQYLKKYF